FASTTQSYGTPCLRPTDARSNIQAMGSWRPLYRQRQRFAALLRFSASCLGVSRRGASTISKFGSVAPPENRSSIMTIFLDAPFSWPPGSAPTHSQNKSWYRTSLPNYALG